MITYFAGLLVQADLWGNEEHGSKSIGLLLVNLLVIVFSVVLSWKDNKKTRENLALIDNLHTQLMDTQKVQKKNFLMAWTNYEQMEVRTRAKMKKAGHPCLHPRHTTTDSYR